MLKNKLKQKGKLEAIIDAVFQMNGLGASSVTLKQIMVQSCWCLRLKQMLPAKIAKIFTKPVQAFKIDNDERFSQLSPHLQYFGWNKTILSPASGPNPVHCEMGSWQANICPSQLWFCLSDWMKSSNSDIMSQIFEKEAASGHKVADRPSSL